MHHQRSTASLCFHPAQRHSALLCQVSLELRATHTTNTIHLKKNRLQVLSCWSGLKRGWLFELPAAARWASLAHPQAGQAPQPHQAPQALQAGSLCQPVGGSLCEFYFLLSLSLFQSVSWDQHIGPP